MERIELIGQLGELIGNHGVAVVISLVVIYALVRGMNIGFAYLTSKLQKQQRVRHNDEMNALLRDAPIGILRCDDGGRIEMANEALCQLSGYHLDELVGENFDLFIDPKVRRKHRMRFQMYIRAASPRRMGDGDKPFLLYPKQGDPIPVFIAIQRNHFAGELKNFAWIHENAPKN